MNSATLQPASFASRAVAYILDNIFVGFIAGIFIQLLWGDVVQQWAQAYMSAVQTQQQPPLPPGSILLAYVFMFAIYNCWSWTSRGATWGQRILGIVVANADMLHGKSEVSHDKEAHVDSLNKISFYQALLRFVILYGVATVAGPFAVVILCLPMLNNPMRRALHDLLAKSVVVTADSVARQIGSSDVEAPPANKNSREF